VPRIIISFSFSPSVVFSFSVTPAPSATAATIVGHSPLSPLGARVGKSLGWDRDRLAVRLELAVHALDHQPPIGRDEGDLATLEQARVGRDADAAKLLPGLEDTLRHRPQLVAELRHRRHSIARSGYA
jgi:hypothetical protein